jgi:hypothetical protein
MERVADSAVAEAPEKGESSDRERYRELLALYGQTLKGIRKLALREKTPGVAALFGPIPWRPSISWKTCPQGGRAIRVFQKEKQTAGPPSW